MARFHHALLGSALGAAGVYAVPALLAVTGRASALGVRTRVTDANRVALTFDDGPQPHATCAMLRALDELDVRATFFVVGRHVERHPGVVREIAAAGHEVANHGFVHRNHLQRDPRGIADDMRRGHAAIADATGTEPTMFRPPQGVVTAATVRAARELDTPIVLWQQWGRDWRRRATTETVVHDVTSRLAGGDILLLHDADWYGAGSHGVTIAATRRIVDYARDGGYDVGPVDGAHSLAP